jgi:hypothetical protein
MKIDIITHGFEDELTLRIFDLSNDAVQHLVSAFEDVCQGIDRKIGGAGIDSTETAVSVLTHRDDNCLPCLEKRQGGWLWSMPSADWEEATERARYFLEVSQDRNRFQWLAGIGLGSTTANFSVLISESPKGGW